MGKLIINLDARLGKMAVFGKPRLPYENITKSSQKRLQRMALKYLVNRYRLGDLYIYILEGGK